MIAAVVVIADVDVDVIEPVIVAVHANVNATVAVLRPVDVRWFRIVDGRDHDHGIVPVQVHDNDHGNDHAQGHDHGREDIRPR